MADQKPVAKTDMAALITDNKSGVPDRPTAVSQKLKNEQAVYQRDVLGQKDVPLPVEPEENAGGKKHELTNVLQRQEARLQKIGQHLDKPDLLEQKLREQTTQKSETGFASSANIKTDTKMRMTDDVRGPSPDQGAGPRVLPAPSGPRVLPAPSGGGGGGPKLVPPGYGELDLVLVEITPGNAGGQQPPGGAPMKLPSREKVTAGKATRTSYATDGSYPKTDMAAIITDNRSKMKDMSRTALEDLRRQEESYARDRMRMAALAQGPPVASTRDNSMPGRSGRASMQQGAGTTGGGGTAGSRRETWHGMTVLTATPDPEDETSSTSEEQPMTCWLMPQPPMLEMEVDEDNDYDPYSLRISAVQVGPKPEEGRVMYPSKRRHKTRRPKKQDSDLVFQDELVISSGGSVTLDDAGGAGYADEGKMRVEETEDVLYVEDIVYQGGQGGSMMQPVGQPGMQPTMQPMMGSQPMMQPMGQPMMPQMGGRLPL
ncbi:hypothetical protein MTO96_002845 [Rhipicephalus appendiculatus]